VTCATCGAYINPRLKDLHIRWHSQQMTVPALEWGTSLPAGAEGIRSEATESIARAVSKEYGARLYCRIPGDGWTEVQQ
jgi:hypothetical protein